MTYLIRAKFLACWVMFPKLPSNTKTSDTTGAHLLHVDLIGFKVNLFYKPRITKGKATETKFRSQKGNHG